MIYVYAGFRYQITGSKGEEVATPLPGQHPAANKQRHRMNAVEQWRDEGMVSNDRTD